MNRFCHECGVAVSDANRFCNKCGARLLPTQPASPDGSGQANAQSPATFSVPPDLGPDPRMEKTAPLPGLPSPAASRPSPPLPHPAGTGELTPNMAGMLCYPLSFLTGILFLVLSPYHRDRFVRFHAYQSIFFAVALLLLNVMLGIVSIILPGFLERIMNSGLNLLGLGGTAWLMYQAYLGNQFALPVIGEMAENQSRKA